MYEFNENGLLTKKNMKGSIEILHNDIYDEAWTVEDEEPSANHQEKKCFEFNKNGLLTKKTFKETVTILHNDPYDEAWIVEDEESSANLQEKRYFDVYPTSVTTRCSFKLVENNKALPQLHLPIRCREKRLKWKPSLPTILEEDETCEQDEIPMEKKVLENEDAGDTHELSVERITDAKEASGCRSNIPPRSNTGSSLDRKKDISHDGYPFNLTDGDDTGCASLAMEVLRKMLQSEEEKEDEKGRKWLIKVLDSYQKAAQERELNSRPLKGGKEDYYFNISAFFEGRKNKTNKVKQTSILPIHETIPMKEKLLEANTIVKEDDMQQWLKAIADSSRKPVQMQLSLKELATSPSSNEIWPKRQASKVTVSRKPSLQTVIEEDEEDCKVDSHVIAITTADIKSETLDVFTPLGCSAVSKIEAIVESSAQIVLQEESYVEDVEQITTKEMMDMSSSNSSKDPFVPKPASDISIVVDEKTIAIDMLAVDKEETSKIELSMQQNEVMKQMDNGQTDDEHIQVCAVANGLEITSQMVTAEEDVICLNGTTPIVKVTTQVKVNCTPKIDDDKLLVLPVECKPNFLLDQIKKATNINTQSCSQSVPDVEITTQVNVNSTPGIDDGKQLVLPVECKPNFLLDQMVTADEDVKGLKGTTSNAIVTIQINVNCTPRLDGGKQLVLPVECKPNFLLAQTKKVTNTNVQSCPQIASIDTQKEVAPIISSTSIRLTDVTNDRNIIDGTCSDKEPHPAVTEDNDTNLVECPNNIQVQVHMNRVLTDEVNQSQTNRIANVVVEKTDDTCVLQNITFEGKDPNCSSYSAEHQTELVRDNFTDVAKQRRLNCFQSINQQLRKVFFREKRWNRRIRNQKQRNEEKKKEFLEEISTDKKIEANLENRLKTKEEEMDTLKTEIVSDLIELNTKVKNLHYLNEEAKRYQENSQKNLMRNHDQLMNIIVYLQNQRNKINKKLQQKWRIFGKHSLRQQINDIDVTMTKLHDMTVKISEEVINIKRSYQPSQNF